MTRFLARMATGLIFVSFGVWELTEPAQWIGYVPPLPAARFEAVPLVLAHGWVLLMLGAAAWINLVPAVTAWLAVAALAEVVAVLLWTSGLSATCIRDIGLLALSLVWAVEETGPHLEPIRTRDSSQ